MEDDLNCFPNGRRPTFFVIWKTTLIFFQMEDDLYCFQTKDILNCLVNERRPQYFGKWMTTSLLWQMEDDLNVLIGKAGLASPSLS